MKVLVLMYFKFGREKKVIISQMMVILETWKGSHSKTAIHMMNTSASIRVIKARRMR
jgi:hypothetical protein